MLIINITGFIGYAFPVALFNLQEFLFCELIFFKVYLRSYQRTHLQQFIKTVLDILGG